MTRGYKQTPAGVIPADWEIETILECCDYADYRGKTPPKSVDGIFLVTARNVRKGFIDYRESQEYVPIEMYGQIMQRGRPRIGDILITTEAPLGNVAQIDREDVALAQRVIKYRPKTDRIAASYLMQYFQSERFQRILDSHSSGSTAKGIKGKVLHQLPVVIPPQHEQQAIAGVLSDLDRLVLDLGHLINKKRDLKQAAMQQLIYGQMRLCGFNEPWGRKLLGEIAEVKTGPFGSSLHESDYVQDGIPIITVEHLGEFGVEHSNLPRVSASDYQRLRSYSLESGDIVFSRVGSVDRNALVRAAEVGWLFSGRLLRVRPVRSLAHSPYISFQFDSERFKQSVKSVAVRQTMASINTQILKGLPVALPSLAEQAAIAEVLSDMDEELSALEQRRIKTLALKQAMMQELLTGRTRLG